MWHRLKPALLLVLLAPLIAEYLSGSLSFAQLPFFPLMALMYGSGALLIRELARRSGRGWPTILALGIAYGVLEEGLATQSLFNPHYLGLRLLDRGFIPSLGIGGPWTVYVVILHLVWSIAVPIGLVEAMFPARRTTPWLHRPGLALSAIAFALGVALVTFGTWSQEHFVASPLQLAAAALIAALFAIAAFALFRPGLVRSDQEVEPPAKWPPAAFALLALVAGSAFHLLTQFGPAFLPPWPQVALGLSLVFLVIAAITLTRHGGAWTTRHTDALVLGGLATYCWLGFLLTARLHGPATILGQLFPLTIVLAAVGLGIVRQKRCS